ncbi:hypothetical protein ABVT39_009236 [Epinephelus coioides]
MERKNNNTNKGGCQKAPQGALRNAQQEIQRLKQQMDSLLKQNSELRAEKDKICQQGQKDQLQMNQLRELLALKGRELHENYCNYQTIERQEIQISQLQKSLQYQTERVEAIKELNVQELASIARQLDDETARASELEEKEAEFWYREKAWQKKVSDLEEKSRQELAEAEERWKLKVQQMQDEQKELEEKFKKDMAQKEQMWERKENHLEVKATQLEVNVTHLEVKVTQLELNVTQLEEERSELEELCLTMKRKMRGFFSRKNEDRETTLQNIKIKMHVKKEKVEKAKKEKLAKEEKAGAKKKGFFQWLHRKKECDISNMVVEEELAGCSAWVGQQ